MNKKKFKVKNLVRENVAHLKPYSSARDEYTATGDQMIFLDANENPFDNGVNRYPDPHQRKLKQKLSEMKGVQMSQILLGNGSDEILDLIFRAFCEPKVDNVISLAPTYGMYEVLAAINNVEEKEVLLTPDFQPDVDAILKEVNHATKIIFLCSPNNPSGNLFLDEEVKTLLDNFNGLVVIDEAYIDFSETESWSKRLQEYPNLIVTQTMSKAYGMAGIRLGIAYASEEIIEILKKIKPPYNVNELTQKKALERLNDEGEVTAEIQKIIQQRELLKNELKQLSFIEKIYPSQANFLLVIVDDADKRYEQLLSNGIVTRNRSRQPLCKNTLRFTVGTASENEALITALKKINNLD